MSSLAFFSPHPGQPLPLVAGNSRLQATGLFARSSQGNFGGRGWPMAYAAVAAVVLKKRPKDPARPRRPQSAFFLFCADFRKENGKLSVPETGKAAGEQWKKMAAEDKAKYEKAVETAMDAYQKDMKEYHESGKAELWERDPNNKPKQPIRAAKRPKDPKRPRRPQSAFFLFSADFRKENGKLSVPETGKGAGEQWKKMAAEDKAKYEKAAEMAMDAYQKDMKEYHESGRAELWKRDPNKPKRPLSAALAYRIDAKIPSSELMKAWAALAASEKTTYEEQYKTKMATYLEDKKKYDASGSEDAWKKLNGIKNIEDAEKAKALKEKERKMRLKKGRKVKKKKAKATKKLK